MKLFMKTNWKKGFTLIEVVVVLVILAVLAAISVPSLTGYISDATDRSRLKETEAIAAAAESAVYKVYRLGTSVEEINGNSTAAKNLRKKILNMAGASSDSKIVSFYVSDGELYNQAADPSDLTNAPNTKDFTEPGTLEFLEYSGSNGSWFGQYRVLADFKSDVRIVDSPDTTHGVSVE